MTAPAGAPPGGGGTKLDDLYYELSLRDEGFGEKVARNAQLVGALSTAAARTTQPLGSMDAGLKSAAAESLRSAEAFRALSAGATETGADVQALAADVERMGEQLKAALAKLAATRPNTSGIDAIQRRIALLAQGANDAGTRAESLRKLEGVEAGLTRTLGRGNLSLGERIRLQLALKDAQAAQQLPRLAQQQAEIDLKLQRGNLGIRERIALTMQLRKLEAERAKAASGTTPDVANAAAALASIRGALAAVGITVGIRELVQFLGDATDRAREFELEMAEVQTVAKVTDDVLGDMAVNVERLFQALPVRDIKELTDGLYEIISAGIPAAEALETLEVAARGAIGGRTDVKTAVDGLTTVVNAYRDAALDATTASDQMFAAAAAGKTSFPELSRSMGLVVGTASAMGTSLRDVLAVTAQATNVGQSTSQAMTGLQSAIQNVLRPSEEFRREFPELAASFDEGRLKGLGFIEFLLAFQRESGGSSRALKTLFRDTEGYRLVVKLLADDGVGLVAMQKEIADSAGATATAFATIDETADAANQRLKNELAVTMRGLGENALPLVNEGLRVMVALLREATDQDEGIAALERVARLRNQNAGAVLGAFDPRQLQQYSASVRQLFADVRAGTLDVAKMTGQDLRALEEAFARDLAARRRVTVDDLRTGSGIRRGLGDTGNADDQAYDSVIHAIAQVEAAEAAQAQARERRAASTRGANREAAEAAAEAGQEAAANALAYQGEADAAANAGRQRAAALRAIAGAQTSLTTALEAAKRAETEGDDDGAFKARQAAEGARSTIEAQQAVLREAQDVLARKAKEIATGVSAATSGIADAIAGSTRTGVDNALAALARYRAEVAKLEREAGHALPALRAEIERQAEAVAALEVAERATAQRKITGIFDEASASQLPALRAGLADLLDEIDRANTEYVALGKAPLVTDEQRAKVIALREGVIETTAAIEAARDALQTFDDARALGGLDGLTEPGAMPRNGIQEMGAALEQLDALKAQLALLPAVDAQGKKIAENEKRRRDLLAEIAKIMARIKELQDETTEALEETRRKEEERARAINEAASQYGALANAVIGLGESFGFLDGQAAAALGSIVEIGKGIARFAAGDVIGGITQGIGGLTGIANSIVGESPEEREQKRIQRETNERLRELNSTIGNLGEINAAGSDVTSVQRLSASVAQRFGTGGIGPFGAADWAREFGAMLAQAGLSLAQLRDVAKEFRIDLPEFIQPKDIAKLSEVMRAAELTEFAHTFEGQMQALENNIFFLGTALDEPAEQFAALAGALRAQKIPLVDNIPGGGGLLGRTLAAQDLTTADGIAAAEAAVVDLFKRMSTLTAQDLGGLTGGQFLDGLKQAFKLIQDAKEALGGAGGAAEVIARVAFELDVLGTSDAAERIRAITAALLETASVDFGEFRDEVERLADPTVTGAERESLIAAVLARLQAPDVDLGTFSLEDFRGLFRDLAVGTRPPEGVDGTGGFNVDRTVTEETATRQVAIARTQTVLLGEIARATGATAAAVTGGAFTAGVSATAAQDLAASVAADGPAPTNADALAALFATLEATIGGAGRDVAARVDAAAEATVAALAAVQDALGAAPVAPAGAVPGGRTRLDVAPVGAPDLGAMLRALLPATLPVQPPAAPFPPAGHTRTTGGGVSLSIGSVTVPVTLPASAVLSEAALTRALGPALSDALYAELLARLQTDEQMLRLARGVVSTQRTRG